MSLLQTCVTCNTSGEGDPTTWHHARHPFRSAAMAHTGAGWQTPSEGRETTESPTPMPAYPFDPILRQALIDKGVITPQDLKDAQAKIEVVTAVFQNETGGKPYVHMREVTDDD
jgi:hypothetical protein